MGNYISFVKDTSTSFEFIDGENEYLFVGPILTVNLLVGANNSRKSRFMRMLLKSENMQIVNKELKQTFQSGLKTFDVLRGKIGSDVLINVLQQDMNIMNANKWMDAFNNHKTENREEQFSLFNTCLRTEGDRLIFDQQALDDLKNRFIKLFIEREDIQRINHGGHITRIANFLELLYQNHYQTRHIGDRDIIAFDLISKLEDEFSELVRCFKRILEDTTQTTEVSKVFIPSLRGSLPLYKTPFINEPLYEQTTREYYFTGTNNHDGTRFNTLGKGAKISAGDNLYDTILIDRNSNIAQREKFEEFQKFISHNFFGDERVEIVSKPKSAEQKISVFINGEEERELKNLGDGIQHLLILLYPIFMAEDNTWIFIDEPELSLHPGFQNLLLETILNNEDLKAKNLRYVMTTHSNHFLGHALRSPSGVSVFSFSQNNKTQSLIRCVRGADTDVLDQLGVENASVYMANCSIWVEGVSDRRYIQSFLKSYCNGIGKPEFKEGLDYTFFEYAGSNLTHYLFEPDVDDPDMIDSFKNANRIFLLADFDKDKEKKHKKLEKIAEESTTSFEYHTTVVREIENLLPPEIYQEFIQGHKSQKDKIFKAKLDDYPQEQMGAFLKENSGDKPLEYGTGTLSTGYKNELSQLVLKKGYNWDLLRTSEELERLTTAVYSFVEKHNTPMLIKNLHTEKRKQAGETKPLRLGNLKE